MHPTVVLFTCYNRAGTPMTLLFFNLTSVIQVVTTFGSLKKKKPDLIRTAEDNLKRGLQGWGGWEMLQ
jgi:hypothetical protein